MYELYINLNLISAAPSLSWPFFMQRRSLPYNLKPKYQPGRIHPSANNSPYTPTPPGHSLLPCYQPPLGLHTGISHSPFRSQQSSLTLTYQGPTPASHHGS